MRSRGGFARMLADGAHAGQSHTDLLGRLVGDCFGLLQAVQVGALDGLGINGDYRLYHSLYRCASRLLTLLGYSDLAQYYEAHAVTGGLCSPPRCVCGTEGHHKEDGAGGPQRKGTAQKHYSIKVVLQHKALLCRLPACPDTIT